MRGRARRQGAKPWRNACYLTALSWMRAGSRRPSQRRLSAPRRLIGVIGLALALAYLVMLSGAWLQGQFLTDAEGRPIANDFVDVYAAGRHGARGRSRRRPTTGRCTRPLKCACSAMIFPAGPAG